MIRSTPALMLAAALLATTLVTGLVVAASAETSTGRLAGESRFDTAVAISQSQFPTGAATIYLARAVDPLVDALAGGSLTNGPILLVPPCGDLPNVVSGELSRLGGDRVIALGGPAAVCDDVLAAAATAASATPSRLAGANRFTTAVAISNAQFPMSATTVYLARATPPLVDALAGGSLVDGPILLVPSCGVVPTEVTNEISRLAPNRVVALGGETAVCSQVLDDAAAGRDTGRFAGETRFDTAVAISQARFPSGAPTVFLARAVEPLVDALAGGVLTDGPVLLVPPCGDIPAVVQAEIDRLSPDQVVALGGEDAVCQTLLDTAAGSIPSPSPSPSPTSTGTPGPTPPPHPEGQRDALVAVFNALDGPNWTTNSGWSTDADECEWFGVSCSGGAVSELVLQSNALAGAFPAELGQLTALRKLGLSDNGVTGLPPEISQLVNLTNLGLRDNALPSLPDEVGDLPALQDMNLLRNQLVGDITGWVTGLVDNGMTNLKLADAEAGNNCLTVTDAAAKNFLDSISPMWDRCDP